MSAPELLPCPFCGGTRVHYYPLHRLATRREHPFVGCHGCSASIKGVSGDYSPTAESAVVAWNTRTDLSAAREAAARREGIAQALAAYEAGNWYQNPDVIAAIRALKETDQ